MRVANPHGDAGSVDYINGDRVAVRFDDQSWNVWRAVDLTPLCPSCGEAHDADGESSWQQWQCGTCGGWNDKDSTWSKFHAARVAA